MVANKTAITGHIKRSSLDTSKFLLSIENVVGKFQYEGTYTHGRLMKENTQTHICRAINMSNALKQKSNNLNETKPLLHTLFKPSYV